MFCNKYFIQTLMQIILCVNLLKNPLESQMAELHVTRDREKLTVNTVLVDCL